MMKLDEWEYPQGDFETRIALVIAFSLIIIGIIYGTQIQL